jgi:cytochrome c-type biogenesis protein CcmH/NrfG
MSQSVDGAGPPVKKEIVITAVVFLGVGFLAGYVYKAQSVPSGSEVESAPLSPTDEGPASGASAGASGQALPPGHPPIADPATIQMIEQQASQNPNDPAPALQLANLFFDQGQYDQAVPWYQKALQLDPKNVSARTDLGTCFFNLGKPDEALREFRQSLEIDPRHEPTLFNVVVVNLEGKHDLRAAREAWEKLHRLNPNYPNLDSLKQRIDSLTQ